MCHSIYNLLKKISFTAATKKDIDMPKEMDNLGNCLKCKICDFKTKRLYRLVSHSESKHLDVQFPCDTEECPWKGKSNESLRVHKLNKHTRIIQKKCQECDHIAYSNTGKQHHINSVHKKIRYYCDKCNFESTTRNNLRTHQCRHSCSFCEWKKELDSHTITTHREKYMNINNTPLSSPAFTVNENENVDSLKEYMSNWFNKNKYNCRLCQKTFVVEAYLLKHFKDIHCDSSIRCEKCDITLKNKSTLRSHNRVHKSKNIVKCIYCNYITVFSSNPSNDPMIRHLGNVHGALLPFKCLYCDDKFSTYKLRKRHMKSHDEAKPFKCEHCQMAFIHDCQLKAHSEIHNTEKNQLCSKCLKSYPSERLLKTHQNIHTEQYKKKLLEANKYFCSLDNCTNTTGYRSEKDLERHVMLHTGEKPFSCNVCDYTTSNINTLRKHERTHMGEGPDGKPYKCSMCDKRFRARGTLTQHELFHNNTKKFSCPQCDKKFRHKTTLKYHIRSHTGEKPYSCQIKDCSKKFATHSAVIVHFKYKHCDNKNITCQECGLAVKTKPSLRKHKSTVHSSNRLKDVKCTECPKIFYTDSDLKVHKRSHTGETPFRCDHCEKSYGKSQSLEYHINSVHILTERTQVCNTCNRAFRDSGSLKVHLQRHMRDNSERTHKCDVCDHSFFNPTHLRNHKQTHSNALPYVCTVCTKGFKTTSQLSYHMNSHANKTFACEFCFRKYNKSGDWVSHVKIVHKEGSPFKCSNCSLRFVASFEIRAHQETCSVKIREKEELVKEGIQNDPYIKLLSRLEDPSNKSATKVDERGRLRHICNLCNMDFSVAGTLRDHNYRKHNIGPTPSRVSSAEMHECDECSFSANTRKGLCSHSKVHNRHLDI